MENEILETIFLELEDNLDKVINHLKGEFNNIRAGRANPHILDKILVDYYGTPTNINHMANVTVSEGRQLVISPWDVSMVKAITKEIIAAIIKIIIITSLNWSKNLSILLFFFFSLSLFSP